MAGAAASARLDVIASLDGAGLNLTDARPDEVGASLNLLVTQGLAGWRVTGVNGNLQIPKLPAGMTCRSVPDRPLATITMPLSGLFLSEGAARFHRATHGAVRHGV